MAKGFVAINNQYVNEQTWFKNKMQKATVLPIHFQKYSSKETQCFCTINGESGHETLLHEVLLIFGILIYADG